MRLFHAHRSSLFVLAGVAAFAIGGGQASAATIVFDNFNGSGSLNGRTPSGPNQTGRTLGSASQSTGTGVQPGIDTGVGNPAPSANTGFNGSTFIDITSTGGYTKPTTLTLSADLQLNTIVGDANLFRGVGLGFYPAAKASGVEQNLGFTGLVLAPDGTLRLEDNGNGSATITAAPPAGFNKANFYNLTYTVNTATGGITSVNLNGTDLTASFSGANSAGVFTDPKTNFAAFYGSTAANAAFFGHVDNFLVTDGAVPEPAAVGLLGVAATGLLARRRKA